MFNKIKNHLKNHKVAYGLGVLGAAAAAAAYVLLPKQVADEVIDAVAGAADAVV